ncbi:MAG TPA: TlpA disulfide reductase family protein [Nevskiaceae bacterium]
MPPAPPSAQPEAQVYKQGARVGGYTLPDLAGRPTRLARWQGKVLLLNFWATWCGPCRSEMPMLARMQRVHAGDGLQIVGIAMEQAQATKPFLDALRIDYPILVGINADPMPTTTFGDTAGALPYSVLVSRSGRVLATHLGVLDPANVTAWLARAGQGASDDR